MMSESAIVRAARADLVTRALGAIRGTADDIATLLGVPRAMIDDAIVHPDEIHSALVGALATVWSEQFASPGSADEHDAPLLQAMAWAGMISQAAALAYTNSQLQAAGSDMREEVATWRRRMVDTSERSPAAWRDAFKLVIQYTDAFFPERG